jgi:paraquat-inducible protein B
MSKPANKTVIGIFVVVALALVVAAVIVLGSGKFFKNNPKFVMYFQGSVKGLAAGSPVNFRGVKVGTVTEIKMLLDPKDLSVMIPVYVEFEPGSIEAMPGNESVEQYRKTHGAKGSLVKDLINRGLRAQLEMQSVVTGQLMVSLDLYPDKPAHFVGEDKRYPEIPTIPTTFQQLADKLEKLPIEEIVAKVDAAMSGIEKIANSPDTTGAIKAVRLAVDDTRTLIQHVDDKLVTSVQRTMDDTRSLVQRVDKQVDPVAAKMTDLATKIDRLVEHMDTQMGPLTSSIAKTSEEAVVTLKKAQTALDTFEDAAAEDTAISYRLSKVLTELGATARSLRLLADTLQQEPESIIFGKKNKRGK